MQFWEPLDDDGQGKGSDEKDSQLQLYATKCVCILSHHGYFGSFKSALRLLYQISLGPGNIPIERYISHLVNESMLPLPGSSVIIDWGLGDSQRLVFSRPPRLSLPMSGVSFLPMFHMLSIPTMLKLWTLMLREERILLMSMHPALITLIAEAVRVLLFPLDWCGVYIPMSISSMATSGVSTVIFLSAIYSPPPGNRALMLKAKFAHKLIAFFSSSSSSFSLLL